MNKGPLSAAQMDALREAGNIGAGNAAMALSQLLGKKVEVSVPRAAMLSLAEVPYLVGGPEVVVAGVYLRINGEFTGGLLLLFDRESAMTLAATLVEGWGEEGVEDALKRSALTETGSILSGAYLNALGLLTRIFFRPSVPGFALDMAGAIMDHVIVDVGAREETVLVLETDFKIPGQEITGHLVLFPESGSIGRVLKRLGVPIE